MIKRCVVVVLCCALLIGCQPVEIPPEADADTHDQQQGDGGEARGQSPPETLWSHAAAVGEPGAKGQTHQPEADKGSEGREAGVGGTT